jgi:hypothetical protein
MVAVMDPVMFTTESRLRDENASDQRDYILDPSGPERTPSDGAESPRQQKHPGTFQCTLCPKRFTRAYNLRSHLRTHTDERPFVCGVCGIAFSRQHDRKRHQGLHTGEKKFVCRGLLQSTSSWGCGRRFARADSLGRHFRSGSWFCIKPLLDEEVVERQRTWLEPQQQPRVALDLVAPQPMLENKRFMPAALLQQYPALAGLDWNSLPQGPPQDEEAMDSNESEFESEQDLGTVESSPSPPAHSSLASFNQISLPQSQTHDASARGSNIMLDFEYSMKCLTPTDDKSPPDQYSDSTSHIYSRVPIARHPLQALELRHVVPEDRRLADALELERKVTSNDRCLLVNAFRIR